MTGQITISVRAQDGVQATPPDWFMPFPPEAPPGGEPYTLRDLIARIVREEIASFRRRLREQRLTLVFSEREIEAGLRQGRVARPPRIRREKVVEEDAVDAALKAFEDGLYRVVLDDEEQRDLDQPVFLQPDSEVTFIRLTALSGNLLWWL
ncbi:MAG: hypothetical protein WCO56_01915 [Verrucomicrobiota bacterium]